MYIGIALTTSVVYHITLKTENARREKGMRDEIIHGVNDSGDSEAIEKLARLNGRFETVDDAKREKGDSWSGYRYVL